MEISTLELVKLAQNNDEFAKERLMMENSPLIKSVIKRYKNKGVEYEDLYQLGSLGFLKAINNFDESFNVKFSTYAVPMIAGEIKRFMRDNGIIKVSRSVKALNIQITKFNEEYVKAYVEYAKYLINKEDFKDAQRKLRKACKLENNNQEILNLLFYTCYRLVKENLSEYNVKEVFLCG